MEQNKKHCLNHRQLSKSTASSEPARALRQDLPLQPDVLGEVAVEQERRRGFIPWLNKLMSEWSHVSMSSLTAINAAQLDT